MGAVKKYKVLSPFLGASRVFKFGEKVTENDLIAGDLEVKLGNGHLTDIKEEPVKKDKKFHGK